MFMVILRALKEYKDSERDWVMLYLREFTKINRFEICIKCLLKREKAGKVLI